MRVSICLKSIMSHEVEEDIQEFLGSALGTLQLFCVLGAEKGSAVGIGVVELSFLVSSVLVPVSRLVLLCLDFSSVVLVV